MKDEYTAIDLFCGAGGLSVGLKKAGFKVLAGVELNSIAAETYRLNHKNHMLYEKDIRDLNPLDILNDLNLKAGELDLLAGCPPCQGFSTHRTRKKSTFFPDDRNELIFEFVRIVEGILPKTIMLENVPALKDDYRMQIVVDRLERLGYLFDENSVSIRDAANFGVPQRRKRMIVMASRYGYLEKPKEARKRVNVRDALSILDCAGSSGDPLHDLISKRSERVNKIISMIPKNGGSRSDLPLEYWLDCHKRNPHGFTDVYGRMSWDLVSPTITGGCNNPSKGRFIHPEENREITLREAAILQTFPKTYKFSLSRGKDAVALMIGNALPPEFIKRQAMVVFDHIRKIKGL